MKARNYREVKGQAYTRRKYIRGSPVSKIVKFTMGNTAGIYKYQARLFTEKAVKIRHNALKTNRIASKWILSEKIRSICTSKILTFVNYLIKKNKMVFGVHANRIKDELTTKQSDTKTKTNGEFSEWLAIKLFKFLFVPLLGLLSYLSGARPFIMLNYGEWYVGFIDGVIAALSMIMVSLYINSKIPRST